MASSQFDESTGICTLTLTPDETTLLQIALYEYGTIRSPASMYVDRRYPPPNYSDQFRKEKLLDVERRIAQADQLREHLFPTH